MRNIIIVSLSALFLIVAGSLTISWYIQARQAKNAIETFAASLANAQSALTFDAIETSGFPFTVNISLVRPHFKGRLDTLLPPLSDGTTRPQWLEDSQLNGRITLVINALSDHYTMRIDGNWQQHTQIGGQSIASVSEVPMALGCELQMQRSENLLSSLWKLQLPARDPQTFLRELRLLDCSSPAYGTVDANTHEVLMHNGPLRWYISDMPKQDRRTVRVYIQSSDAEITAGGDKMLAAYMQALAPDHPLPVQFSAYGKQQLNVDFSYDGPQALNGAIGITPLDIQLNTLELHNQLYNINAAFHLMNGGQKDVRTLHLTLKTQSDASEQYDGLIRNILHNAVAQYYAHPDAHNDALHTIMQRYTPDSFFDALQPALPELHTLGEMTSNADVAASGNDDFSAANITLNALELSATPYGITGNGTVKTIKNQMPASNITLDCRNCSALIDDVTAYALRLQQVSQLLSPTPAPPKLDAQRIAGIKSFLTALALHSSDNSTFRYMIASNQNGPSLNGKNAQQIWTLYNEYVPKPQEK